MKNRSTFSKLTAMLFCAGIMAITGCSGNHINDTNADPQKSLSGTASVSVNVGKIGQLAKRTAIEMEKLVIEIKVKDSTNAIVNDTSALSGFGEKVITKTFPSLTAPENFVVQATAFDKTGKMIHSGSAEFSTIPADTVDVSLDLDAMYSMLRVAFNDIPDSVSNVRLKIAAIDTVDSAFTRGTRDTIVFHHDYIPADKNGKNHSITLEASGSFYGKDTVLYAADAEILAKAGVDTSYQVVLKWVGPGVPKGAATMTVNIGSVGTTTVNAGFGVMAVGIPVDGLVAYYPFNGNANDMSGNGNDGVVNGAMLVADRFGVSGKAYSFDGVNDYINCGNNAILNLLPEGATISAWFKNDKAIASTGMDFRTIVGKRSASNGYGYGMDYGFWKGDNWSTSGFRADIVNYGGYSGTADIKMDTVTWVHIVGIFSNNIGLIYINGIKVSTVQGTSGFNNTISNLYIGRQGEYSRPDYHAGKIDDIRIYNRALTESEISALYHENGWTGN